MSVPYSAGPSPLHPIQRAAVRVVSIFACLVIPGIPRVAAEPPSGTNAIALAVPAPAPAAEELSLGDLFLKPVGPRGLEFSERARALVGKKVRMQGFMVRQSTPIPYAFLLSPAPMTLHEREYGLCEDLPPNTVHVFLPRSAKPVTPFVRGPVAAEGLLELGVQEEPDGRIATVRLRVEAGPSANPKNQP